MFTLKNLLIALAIAGGSLFLAPSDAAAQYGPCGPTQWQQASSMFNNLETGTYELDTAALDGLHNGILPGLGYNCDGEFQWAWTNFGSYFVAGQCQGQGFVCIAHWSVWWAQYYLEAMAMQG